jgi:hypothetical protein
VIIIERDTIKVTAKTWKKGKETALGYQFFLFLYKVSLYYYTHKTIYYY